MRGGLVVAVVAGFLASCANTTPSRYYILAPVIQPVSPVQLVQHAQGPLVRVGPISVPPYLDRPNIVTRRGANGIELAQLDSWAEPLKDNITRVLVDNLSALSPGRRIVASSSNSSAEVDHQITVAIHQLDGDVAGSVRLVAFWGIYGKGGRGLSASGRFERSELAANVDPDTLVAAQSRLIGELSREIYNELARQIRAQ